jgi:hypothetical protein
MGGLRPGFTKPMAALKSSAKGAAKGKISMVKSVSSIGTERIEVAGSGISRY